MEEVLLLSPTDMKVRTLTVKNINILVQVKYLYGGVYP